jgi:hypothetical protein
MGATSAQASITALVFSLAAGAYYAWQFYIICSTAAVGTSPRWGLTWAGGTGQYVANRIMAFTSIAPGTQAFCAGLVTATAGIVSMGASTPTGQSLIEIIGAGYVTSNATLQVTAGVSTINASALLILPGTCGILYKTG